MDEKVIGKNWRKIDLDDDYILIEIKNVDDAIVLHALYKKGAFNAIRIGTKKQCMDTYDIELNYKYRESISN